MLSEHVIVEPVVFFSSPVTRLLAEVVTAKLAQLVV